jgi:predicted transcriptional regulator
MNVTNKQTYRIIRAVLEMKKFTQYEISKKEGITFSLVNRVVNWLVSQGYVAKRTGHYELISAGAIFNLFPLNRKMQPYAIFDVNITYEDFLSLIKRKGKLCLTTALSSYGNYFRDPSIHVYLKDKRIIENLKDLPKGYTHIEIYKEDLNPEDFVKMKGKIITTKTRTIIDLFCANKAYAAERLVKKEWL